ncbi:UNVERIFIED_CONTAM: hypothetical protein HHA_281460 [Hammondia hammondi]|eukprot:XP_008887620.1 hypothetical protein HHA_281460 [Hammondia hammondi]
MPTQEFQASSVEDRFRYRSRSLQPRKAGALLLCTACSVVVVLSLASADVVSAAAENDEGILRKFQKAWQQQAPENYEDETARQAPAATSDLSADPPEAGEDGVFLGSRLWQSSSEYYKALVDRLPEKNALTTSASEFLSASQARLSTAWTESREKLSSAFTQSREKLSSLSKLLPKRADSAARASTPVTAREETHAASLAATVPAELTPDAAAFPSASSPLFKTLNSAGLLAHLRQALGTTKTARNWCIARRMLETKGTLDFSNPAAQDIVQKIVVALAIVGTALAGVFTRDEMLRNHLQLAGIPVLSQILEVTLGQGKVNPQRHHGSAAPAEPVVSRVIRVIQTMSSTQLSQIEAKYESVLSRFGVHRGQLTRGLQIAVGDSFARDESDAYAPVYALPARRTTRVESGVYEEESNDAH